jgi:hypothetical protein
MAQISAPVRIVALVGMLAALAMGGWVMTAGMRGGSPGAADATPTPLLTPIAQASAVANKLSAHNTATATGKPGKVAAAAAATAKPKPAATTKHKGTPVSPTALAAEANSAAPATVKQHAAVTPATKHAASSTPALLPGTPHTIASLLATHSVVVVLLYNPRAKVDDFTLGEAVLGATQSKAGFLRVDVLDERQAKPFLQAYGVLQDPTLLFFTRPGKLVHKLYGFADHETVSQAVINASLGIGAAS